jgi:hypothetical protein
LECAVGYRYECRIGFSVGQNHQHGGVPSRMLIFVVRQALKNTFYSACNCPTGLFCGDPRASRKTGFRGFNEPINRVGISHECRVKSFFGCHWLMKVMWKRNMSQRKKSSAAQAKKSLMAVRRRCRRAPCIGRCAAQARSRGRFERGDLPECKQAESLARASARG